MSEFWVFLKLGFQHIADWQAYDHLLFIITLCAYYALKDWKKVLILVTAFTIGHSLTLALSVLSVISINPTLVEILIPVTILATALFNVSNSSEERKIEINYLLALSFGLIHGLGFSNYLRTLLGKGSELLVPLFAFNIGLEIGQIMIVALFFLINVLISKLFDVAHRSWNIFWSGAGFGIALTIIISALAS